MQGDNDPMAPVLATREMHWTRADGVIMASYVDIGMPFLEPPPDADADPAWGCMVRTRGLGDDRIVRVYGVDAIQALYLALVYAGSRVSSSIVANSLDWKEVPNYGFPTAPPIPDEEGPEGCAPCLEPAP